MSIHCQSNKRLGNCKLEVLVQAGNELYKMLTNVEGKARQGRPFKITDSRHEMMTNALNQWEKVNK